MINQTNLCDLCEVYTLGGLDKDEREAFEEHLSTCQECQKSLVDFEEVKEWLLYDFEEVEPNPGMKGRIFQNVFEEETPPTPKATVAPLPVKKRPNFAKWTSGVAAAVVVAAVIVGVSVPRHPASAPYGSILSQGQMTTISANGQAKLYVTKSAGTKDVILQFQNLKPTTGQQVYQVWFINAAGQPISAGTFRLDRTGSWMFSAPVPSGDVKTVAVTLEPNAGNTTPKGTKQFLGSL